MTKALTMIAPKLRFPGFKGEWQVKRLGEVCEVITKGTTPTSIGFQFTDDGINFIKIESLTEAGEIIPTKVAYIDEYCHQALNRSQLKKNDILFSIAGALGRIGIVKEEILPANTNQALAIIRLKNNSNVFVNFIAKYFISNIVTNKIENLRIGAAQQNLSLTQLNNLSIYLPTLPEQQKIADCLSSLDDLITAQVQKVDLLKQHKKGLMQQLFPADGKTVPKLRFPGFTGAWQAEELKSFCFNISSGKDKNIDGGEFDLYGSTGIIGRTENSSYDGNFILVARVGANAGLLNRVNGLFGVTDNTLVVNLKEPQKMDFIFYSLTKIGLNKLVFGSGQPLVTGKQLKELSIPIPTLPEQQKIADCLSSLDDLITTEQQKLAAYKTHKKGLLQQLFPTV